MTANRPLRTPPARRYSSSAASLRSVLPSFSMDALQASALTPYADLPWLLDCAGGEPSGVSST